MSEIENLPNGKENKKPLHKHRNVHLTVGLYKSGLAVLEILEKQFPKCFFARGHEKPLKKGIITDLINFNGLKIDNSEVSHRAITAALQIYTTSLSYRFAIIEDGSKRIDLEGNEVEEVTEKERIQAKGEKKLQFIVEMTKDEFEKFKEIRAERLKAMEKAGKKIKKPNFKPNFNKQGNNYNVPVYHKKKEASIKDYFKK